MTMEKIVSATKKCRSVRKVAAPTHVAETRSSGGTSDGEQEWVQPSGV
jgi:hypothetical protein